MNTNEHIAYLWKICGIVNMIVEYILKKTVTIFADRYRYEKLKFYLHNNFQWKKVHKERSTKQHII